MNIDMLERRFRAIDARFKELETGVPSGAAPAAAAGPTPEEESARVAKIYEDLRAALKAEIAILVAEAKAEIQAFIAAAAVPVTAAAFAGPADEEDDEEDEDDDEDDA